MPAEPPTWPPSLPASCDRWTDPPKTDAFARNPCPSWTWQPLTHFVLTPQDRRDFHRGIRLFNQARFWEAHEAWEAVWLRHPEDGRYFVQGLIQVAAGYHQLRRKIYRGFLIHLRRAQERLVLFPDTFLSVDVVGLRRAIGEALRRIDSEEGPACVDYSGIGPTQDQNNPVQLKRKV